MDRNERRRKRYAEDPEYRAKVRRSIRKHNPSVQQRMLWSAMGRAKKSGVPFDLEVSDITIPELCPALGIPLFQSGKKGPCPNSPSLDRIRSELGYVKGNVVVLSHRANVIKQNASFSELQRIADWVKSVSGPCQKPETVLY